MTIGDRVTYNGVKAVIFSCFKDIPTTGPLAATAYVQTAPLTAPADPLHKYRQDPIIIKSHRKTSNLTIL